MTRAEPYRQSCAFCGSESTKRSEFRGFSRCETCDLAFRDPMPSSDELSSLYETDWHQPLSSTESTGGTTIKLARAYARSLANSLGVSDFKGLRLLDFGAGRGDMMQALYELGADALAVEPYGVEVLRERGFTVFPKLDHLPESSNFDGAVCIDVVEHLDAPWRILQDIRRMLVPGGWAFVATPNRGSLNAMIRRSGWRESTNPGHLHLLSSRSMLEILSGAGFANIYRLRWLIRYNDNPMLATFHYLLQILGLDGELRFLAYSGGT